MKTDAELLVIKRTYKSILDKSIGYFTASGGLLSTRADRLLRLVQAHQDLMRLISSMEDGAFSNRREEHDDEELRLRMYIIDEIVHQWNE